MAGSNPVALVCGVCSSVLLYDVVDGCCSSALAPMARAIPFGEEGLSVLPVGRAIEVFASCGAHCWMPSPWQSGHSIG